MVVDKLSDLSGFDMLFAIVSEGKTSRKSISQGWHRHGTRGHAAQDLRRFVRRSLSRTPSASRPSQGKGHRVRLRAGVGQWSGHQGWQAVVGRVRSGIGVEGAMPVIEVFAPRGVSYVGDGELARICKDCANVMLGVVISNLARFTLLAKQDGVPREAFLAFMTTA